MYLIFINLRLTHSEILISYWPNGSIYYSTRSVYSGVNKLQIHNKNIDLSKSKSIIAYLKVGEVFFCNTSFTKVPKG